MNKLFVTFISLSVCLVSCKKESTSDEINDKKYFLEVKEIVERNCTVSCHAPSKGFYDGMPIVLETDSDIVNQASQIKSAIVDPVTVTNKRMPPNAMLSQHDIDVIEKWIAAGGTVYGCGFKTE